MPDVGTWAKLAAYVVCVGIALEYAHRIYWKLYRRVMGSNSQPWLRSVLCALTTAIPLITVFLITGAFCIYVDRQSFEALGLHWSLGSLGLFSVGTAIAFVSITLLFIGGCRFGWFRVKRHCIGSQQMPAFCGSASDFLLAAVFEEVIVRGYVFTVLLHEWGAVAAVVGSAAVFSLMHIVKHPRMPLIFSINAFFFGLVTGQARLVTGSLWVPIGLHFGWNLAMGPIFGMPCSGRTYDNGLVTCAVDGPEWVTGGLYSPDAGLLGSATLIFATVALTFLVPIY